MSFLGSRDHFFSALTDIPSSGQTTVCSCTHLPRREPRLLQVRNEGAVIEGVQGLVGTQAAEEPSHRPTLGS